MSERSWSKKEKTVARQAYNLAREREYEALMDDVRKRVAAMSSARDVWRLHDFLSRRRREFDDKHDYRYSVLEIVFARLVFEGWLRPDDLEGLAEDRLARICGTVALWDRESGSP